MISEALHKLEFKYMLMAASSGVMLSLTILVMRRMLLTKRVNFASFDISRTANPGGYWFVFCFWLLSSLVWCVVAVLFLAFLFVGG